MVESLYDMEKFLRKVLDDKQRTAKPNQMIPLPIKRFGTSEARVDTKRQHIEEKNSQLEKIQSIDYKDFHK